MSRQPRTGGPYIPPIDVTNGGVELTAQNGPGRYTLAANTTYRFCGGGNGAAFQSYTITGYTAGALATVTVQDTNHGVLEVPNGSNVVGEWVNEDPSTGFVAVDGTGWTQANSIVTVGGTGVGGATFHVGETGAARTALLVVVGGTGGDFRVSYNGKG